MTSWRCGRIRTVVLASVYCLAVAWAVRVEAMSVNPATLQKLQEVYGQGAIKRLREWTALLDALTQTSIDEKIARVNRFFNALQFVPDEEHWNQVDYWATPLEFIASNGGDCEDFAIAKYFTLQALGVDSDSMRLAYVKALELNQAHMVLVYYPAPDQEPMVLDNLVNDILPASQRKDLQPVYSFNAEGLWQARQQGQETRLGTGSDVLMWKTLIQRMSAQERLDRPE
jgi:predicted transglutaminase-like cysteine proteinase